MKKVFITGASGFVGKNLQNYLRQKQVDIVPYSRSEGGSYLSIDATYLDRQQIDVIVHLAGKAHDLKKKVHTDEYYHANTELTKQIFDHFLASSASVFIYMSSIKALADTTDAVLTENMFPQPLTDYGKSKLAAETYLLKQLLPLGKRLYILRPCMIHGPGNKGNLNLLYQLVKRGIPYPLAAFANKRSFLSVENLCFVIDQLMQREDIASGIYHVSDDETLSTIEVVEIIATGLGKKPRLWQIPPTIINRLALMCDLLHLPLTTERLRKLTGNYVVSNNKIVSALQMSLPLQGKDGLQKTFESFKYAI